MNTLISEVVLEKIKFQVSQEFGEEFLHSFEISTEKGVNAISRMAAGNLIVRMKAIIAGQDLLPIEHTYPADWVQAVKDRFAPGWLTKRWPVKYKVFKVDVTALYPELKIPPHVMKPKLYIKTSNIFEEEL